MKTIRRLENLGILSDIDRLNKEYTLDLKKARSNNISFDEVILSIPGTYMEGFNVRTVIEEAPSKTIQRQDKSDNRITVLEEKVKELQEQTRVVLPAKPIVIDGDMIAAGSISCLKYDGGEV